MRIITVRGIGETIGNNLLTKVAKEFPNIEHVDLPWEATYGAIGGRPNGRSFAQATELGEALLKSELDKGQAIVLGYSGGAEVAGNVAAEGHPNALHFVLVADPSAMATRRGNEVLSGIRGERHFENDYLLDKVTWISNPDDVICSCPEDSPLRAFAMASEGFSLADPEFFTKSVLQTLVAEKFRKVLFRPFQRATVFKAYERAYRDACLYLGVNPMNPLERGRCAHTDYSLREAVGIVVDVAW